jgi:WhiB family redox-sensing transcriptional regulator
MTTLDEAHGTRTTYNRGCRCDACRIANRRYAETRRRAAGMQPLAVGPQTGHGTLAHYRQGCRCDACRSASVEQRRRYPAKKVPPPAPRGPVFASIPFDPQPWADDAACVDRDPRLFFPERGEDTRAAKAVCRDCPARNECLEYALEHRIIFGIWGGLSEAERRRIRTQRAKAARMEREART